MELAIHTIFSLHKIDASVSAYKARRGILMFRHRIIPKIS